ncbi:MAG: 4-oxalocrotonate tautomerase [Solirubrobacterales bacterium]|nr:4-oxalocrotonate tautomerase [Solirubrobacterales bacterium]
MPLVQVTLIEGRDTAVKSELIARLTDAVVETTGAPRASVRVILSEVPAEHWGVGGVPKSEMEDR